MTRVATSVPTEDADCTGGVLRYQLSDAFAIQDLVILLRNSRKATKQRGTLYPSRKLCSEEPFPRLHVAAGGSSNSLFGDDLYGYAMGKHSRPPLKLYLVAWRLCSYEEFET